MIAMGLKELEESFVMVAIGLQSAPEFIIQTKLKKKIKIVIKKLLQTELKRKIKNVINNFLFISSCVSIVVA